MGFRVAEKIAISYSHGMILAVTMKTVVSVIITVMTNATSIFEVPFMVCSCSSRAARGESGQEKVWHLRFN